MSPTVTVVENVTLNAPYYIVNVNIAALTAVNLRTEGDRLVTDPRR